MMIILAAFLGLIGIFCVITWMAVQSIGKIELDFSVEDIVSDMYEGHRYGRDD